MLNTWFCTAARLEEVRKKLAAGYGAPGSFVPVDAAFYEPEPPPKPLSVAEVSNSDIGGCQVDRMVHARMCRIRVWFCGSAQSVEEQTADA